MARRWRRWGAAVLRLPGRVRTRWRRSLQFRVVAVTMVLSIVIAVGLGEFVAGRVAKGLQATRYSVATGIAESGFRIARSQLGSYSDGTVNDSNIADAASQLIDLLNAGSADGQLYQVALEFTGDECTMTDFVMSCRVMSRGVEERMLAAATEAAAQRGCALLRLRLQLTDRNEPMLRFLRERSGLATTDGIKYERATSAASAQTR